MADPDPAFQWETEALRAGAQRRRENRPQARTSEHMEPGWVTIRQAEGATGIPIGTLRRWARQGALPSRSQDTDAGTRRLVWLDAVLERAERLGREDLVVPTETVPESERRRAAPPPPPPRTQPHPQPPAEIPGQQELEAADRAAAPVDEPENLSGSVVEVDLRSEREAAGQPQPQPHPEPSHETESGQVPPDPPPGTMLVPVDAWNKMLLQLGNLHEAGRELAEARERAAKAETEATFLRERLKELRERTKPDQVPAVREGRRRWFGNR